MRRALILGALAVAAVASSAEPALVCHCTIDDPRRALARADAAFVGVLVATRPYPAGEGEGTIYTFRVLETVKGSLGEFVDVETYHEGDTCDLSVSRGETVGLLLDRVGGDWNSNYCMTMSPADLRRAAMPLPAPDGRGPAAVLVGGAFGPARMLALDARGRTLRYGMGAHESAALAVCPGSRLVAELVDDGGIVVLRDARTLRRKRVIGRMNDSASEFDRLWCLDRTGSTVLLVPYANPTSVIRFRRGATVLRRAQVHHSDVANGALYLVEGNRPMTLVRVDVRTGAAARVCALPTRSRTFALSSDAARLALLVPSGRRLRLVVVELDGCSRVQTPPIAGSSFAELFWAENNRIVLLDGAERARVYDATLRPVATFRDLATVPGPLATTVALGRLWHVTERGALVVARLPRGPLRTIGRLPGWKVNVMIPARR